MIDLHVALRQHHIADGPAAIWWTGVAAVKFVRMEDSVAVYGVDSGTYRFESAFPETIE